jgi:[ribosomal protein S18]-alanine N-acetyltransferase
MNLEPLNQRRRGLQTLRITEMLSSDIPAVVAIEQQSNLEPWTQESFFEELLKPHSSLVVARISVGAGEFVAGYICFWSVADEIQIFNVAVHQTYRRLGIGRELLVYCLNCGVERRSRIAVLEVRSSNLAAQCLYSRLGFQVVGQRPDYYGGEQEPAVLMELSIVEQPLAWGDKACLHKERIQKYISARAPIIL